MCAFKAKENMENIFMKLLTPELIRITKPKYNKLISYGYFFDFKLVYSLTWIYKYYFELDVVLFLPKIVNIKQTLEEFNELTGEFKLSEEEVHYCSLESIENVKNKVVIYGFGDFIFNDLVILNKRRVCTYLKTNSKKIIILSYTSLKVLNLVPFDSFDYFQMKEPFDSFDFNYIDFSENELEPLVEFIVENKHKSIYLSVNRKKTEIENLLKEHGVPVSKSEEGGVVISNSVEKSFLKDRYHIYIFITKDIEYPLDILRYLKEVQGAEVYFDSSKIKNVTKSFKDIQKEITPERITIKDSKEYDTYNELSVDTSEFDCVVVSEYYYKFDSPETIKSLDLKNLTKKDYDTIRNYVKIKLTGKFDMDVKTCQLSSPCSPKDRSKKLNSLSNKISSYDYRCDVTCEIFNDYTIGVVLWNEMFSNRKEITVTKNQLFIHQTTSGKWKFTTVS